MTTATFRSNVVPLTRLEREPRCRIVSFDEDSMTNENTSAGGTAMRDIPIDWEALEDAFENNAPEVHSYLHLVTGDVLRVWTGWPTPRCMPGSPPTPTTCASTRSA